MKDFENNNNLNNNTNDNFEQVNNQNIVNENEYKNNVIEEKTPSQDYSYKVFDSVGETIQNISDEQPNNEINTIPNSNQQQANFSQFNYQQANSSFEQNRNAEPKPSSIQIVTLNKKNKKFRKRLIATCATVAIFGGSVGFGVALGTKTSENLGISNSNSVNFKFQDIPEASQMSISDNAEIINIVKNTSNSVVNISIKKQQKDFFNQIYENTGSGSGIIYKEDTEKIYIVTNNHVIDGATNVNISITGTEQIPAKLVGKEASSDVAVISVLKSDLKKSNITSIKDSSNVEVGEYVLAIGNALGQGKTVTQGIISAQNKQVNIDGKNLTVLQTDAAINPGNSGGALVNSTGKIIGMNTAKLSGSTVEGTGYALPSSLVKSIADELITNGTVAKPYLGISGFTMTDDFIAMYNLTTKGVFIKSVEENSAAKAAGLKYCDIITAINGTPIETMEQLAQLISKSKVGDTITISIVRNGTIPMTVTATLSDMNSKF